MSTSLTPELIEAALAGDRRAYNEVGGWILDTLIVFYTRRWPVEEVHELTQRTARDLLEKFAESPTDPALFRSRVESFANMTVTKYIGERKREQERLAIRSYHPRTPARRLDSRLELRQLLTFIRGELAKLGTPERTNFLRSVHGESAHAVAEDLNIPAGTFRRRVWQVRRLLVRALGKTRPVRLRT